MRKHLARVVLMALLLIQMMPMAAYGEEEQSSTLTAERPQQPYEKVMDQTGNWYSEQIPMDGKAKLVLQYRGDYREGLFDAVMGFSLTEKTVLRGIYLPYAVISTEAISIQLTDGSGNTYPPFSAQPVVLDEAAGKMNYVCSPAGDIILEKGDYQMTVSNPAGAVGAFAIKGLNYEAYERFKETLPPLGNEEFAGEDPSKYEPQSFESVPEKKPAMFSLDQEYQIDEIIMNTYMDGAGAAPGTISILAEDGTVLFTQQAAGGKLGDTANGIWTVAPGGILPAGNYFVAMSDPGVLSYDQSGEPMFYVKASVPTPIRYDFTGTYKINFDAFKTSTIMGPVSETASSFSLQNFELAILDKTDTIEFIGKYKGIPFSQECQIIEETETSVTAAFSADADLTKLPYKAMISGEGTIVLTRPEGGAAQISIQGTGRFQREASKDLGADDNTYSLVSNGLMVSKDLPLFVVNALGKSGGVGAIPGPDSPAQAAAGMLFPPLIGLVASVLQDLLKPKAKPVPKPVVRDKSWYKKKYPDLDDNQLAMAMLADAMGNTDEPDLEDGESEPAAAQESGAETDDGQEEEGSDSETEDYEPEDYETDESSTDQDETDSQVSQDAPEQEAENPAKQEEPPQPEENKAPEESKAPEEPEEMVLKTSANGAESSYIKDPKTGEWINKETGNILDYEKYKSTVAQQLEDDKKFNDEQFEKNSNGETAHDKALREEMKKIANAEMLEEHRNKMKSKYGTDDMDELDRIMKEKQAQNQANNEHWTKMANIYDAGDKVATGVGVLSDVAVDGLSTITPYGSSIKAGYKVAKNVCGTVADKGMSWGSVVEGGAKGVADAGTDYIKINNPYVNAVAKAAVTMTGEAGGSAAGAAMRGEDWAKAGAEGAVDGVFKVAVGTVTDGLAGDFPKTVLGKGSTNILPAVKNVLVSKTAVVKTASGFIDEFGVKPKVAQPIKDSLKPYFQKK